MRDLTSEADCRPRLSGTALAGIGRQFTAIPGSAGWA